MRLLRESHSFRRRACALLVLAPLASIASGACKKGDDSTSKAHPTEAGARDFGGICDDGTKCRTFPTSGEAFNAVLVEGPRVLAIGESHAPAGSATPATIRRFQEELLPILAGKASAMVLELWVGAPRCQAAVTAVATKQKEVTKTQAASNPNAYFDLGTAAKALGIFPLPLTPTCDDYASIVDAGPSDIDAMLRLIRKLTAASVRTRLEKSPEKMVVAYGGLLHNDLAPRKGMEAWSFGNELSDATAGKYVELDLVTPEFIEDSDTWKRLPWFSAFHRERQGGETVLIEPSPKSYVLIFSRGQKN